MQATPNLADSPRRRARWIMPAILVGGLAAALGSLAACNAYIAWHRQLHVVNGFNVPLTVQLESGEPIVVPPKDRVMLSIAEGRHEARVVAAGHALAGGPFEISSSLLARFFKRPVFVLNAGCGAAVIWEETVYGKKTTAGAMHLYAGQPFVAFDDVDCAFTQFPKTMPTYGGTVKRTRVEVFPVVAVQVMAAPLNLVGVSDRLTLAEAHLQLNPNDPALVEAYLATSEQHSQAARAQQFLTAHAIALPAKRVR
jgi:hypothetical protein